MNLTSSESSGDLNGVQQWLQTAIMRPWEADAAKLTHVVREGTGDLDPAQQLGIYIHAYQGRLVECMESEFPVLRLALGAPLFTRFAAEYLMACPSQNYSLTLLGKQFPRYLRETRPEDEDELWPEFMIDLAVLERLFSEVYHGEGLEGAEEIAATETARIAMEPGVRWMKGNFPVDQYFIAARKHLKHPETSEPPVFPEPESIALLIFRRNYMVQLRRVSVDELPEGHDSASVPD